jgi:methionine-rich copper-binding protein CopC
MRRPPGGAGRIISRLAARLAGVVAVASILLAVAAPAASAHATLLFTSPAAGSAVPAVPAVITLTFNQAVTLVGTPVTLAGPGGHRIGLGPARESAGRSVVSVPVTGRLADGVYTVSWQVISSDGDLVGSEFRFAVGPAPASLGSATVSAAVSVPGQWPTAILRWALFAALAAALGGLAGQALAGLYREQAPPVPLPSPWALRASLLGAVASAGLAALQAGGGNLVSGAEHLSVPKLLSSSPGTISVVEVASFAVAAALLRLRRPAWAVVPLLAVVAAEGLRAHPENVAGAGGAVLTWAHLLAAALWAGMLLYVVRAAIAWREHPGAVRARGDNLLTLRVTASGWTGGTASLDVPWPPAPGAALLRRALAAMGQVPAMTVYEQVTSDTALGAGTMHSIGLSGRQYLGGEPYAGGTVPVADLVTGSGGQQVLYVGFPDASTWVELTVGAHDAPYRFAHEILVDPDHLISRGFAYPEKR